MKTARGWHPRDRQRFWILVPALVMILLDVGVTLYFQPAEYWSANYELTTEKSPLGVILLQFHPAAFLAFILAYMLVIGLLIYWLPAPWNRIISLAAVVGHTAGLFSWLGGRVYWVMIVLFIVIAAITVFSWQRAET
jgi:hypothetical protein